MALLLRELDILSEDPRTIPKNPYVGSQMLTWDPTPPSGLYRLWTLMCYTDIHEGKTPVHIELKKKKIKE